MVNKICVCEKKMNFVTRIENRAGLKLKAALQLLVYADDAKLLEENVNNTKTQKFY
jgi:hypothetical protein